MTASLAMYLDKVAARNGQTLDCCAFMADWLMQNGLPDPMADCRGIARSDWQRALESEGGILAACSKRFAEIGLRRTDTPRPGDVAVVLVPVANGRLEMTGAVCTSATLRAVVGSDVALTIAAPRTIRAWELPRG